MSEDSGVTRNGRPLSVGELDRMKDGWIAAWLGRRPDAITSAQAERIITLLERIEERLADMTRGRA